MPLSGWVTLPIRTLFRSSIPGDWGDPGTADDGVAVLRSTNFRDDGSIDFGDIAYRQIAPGRLAKRRIGRGTLLFEKAGGSSTRPAGRVVISDRDFEGTASNFVEIVEVDDGYEPAYVFYLLYWCFHVGRVYKYQQQTTGIINFKLREYAEETVLLPRAQVEQRKIAEVLTTVDRTIERTEAIIAKRQRIKTGLMQDLLTRGLDEQGRLRSEDTHAFRDSPGGRIPQEWDSTTIGDQFDIRRERGRAGIPIMSVVMVDGLVERSGVDRRVQSNLAPEQHALVCAGDIAYNMMRMWQGVMGRASFDCLVSPAYVVLKPKATIDTRFAEWLFRDLRTIHAFRKASKGVVDDRLRLYPVDLFPIRIAIPRSLTEQSQIADRLDAQAALIAAEQRRLQKLQHIRKGLMHDLLTGNRRVTSLLQSREAVTA